MVLAIMKTILKPFLANTICFWLYHRTVRSVFIMLGAIGNLIPQKRTELNDNNHEY